MSEPGDGVARPSVLARATLILDAFAESSGHLLLDEITALTGLPHSTTFRLVRQLVEHGWLEADYPGYRLGGRLRELGQSSVDHNEIRAAAAVALNDLHLATGMVVHLSVLHGASSHYLDKVGGVASRTVPSRVGARIPATSTVSGRAILAQLPPEEVDALLGGSADLEAVHRDLAQVRSQRGVAVRPGRDPVIGVTSMAVPVLGPRGPIAAISVGAKGLIQQSAVAPLLLHTAAVIASRHANL
ncbi:IclR family transcriptional regulator [Nocardioides sp. Bht2]|uniref:IclR family transcriptional regulator n=1 Tax=Nocardioides sp. Bht2 TaxID=3392297 RepID=UPI0039B69CF2